MSSYKSLEKLTEHEDEVNIGDKLEGYETIVYLLTGGVVEHNNNLFKVNTNTCLIECYSEKNWKPSKISFNTLVESTCFAEKNPNEVKGIKTLEALIAGKVLECDLGSKIKIVDGTLVGDDDVECNIGINDLLTYTFYYYGENV